MHRNASKMQREVRAWTKVVVCINRSSVRILGQNTDENCAGSTLTINRTRIDEIFETRADIPEECEVSSVLRGSGILGFLEVKNAVYLGLITKSFLAGNIGPHDIFCVSEIEWIPISFGITVISKTDSRDLGLILNLFRGQDFYYSDTLNVTAKSCRFQWNHKHVSRLSAFSPQWTLDIMHGFFGSVSFSSMNRNFQFALFARRSQFFAGTRYKKRGLNGEGDCANEVELEQILVSLGPPDHVFSFVQIRGSVPLQWCQEGNGLLGRPEIFIKHCDLKLDLTRRHFENLVHRYGSPIIPVSLLMNREGSSETQLNEEYAESVAEIQSRVAELQSIENFDLKGGDALGVSIYEEAREMSRELLKRTQWSHQVDSCVVLTQTGIVRSNCVDCLDRTSIFQYILGLEVLNAQLISLGVLDARNPMTPTWSTGSAKNFGPQALSRLVESLFEAAGDKIALQYAGTAAHKTYSSGRASRQGSIDGGLISSGKELFISLSRHYSSTFTDNDKQNAMNLFLGLYAGIENWEEESVSMDKYVHSRRGKGRFIEQRRKILLVDLKPGDHLDEYSYYRSKEWKQISFNPSNNLE